MLCLLNSHRTHAADNEADVINELDNSHASDNNFWHTHVSEQFAQGLVVSARYYLNAFRADSDSQIIFTAIEYLTDKYGNQHETPIEVVLAKEDDGVWRVLQEKILTHDEARAAGVIKPHSTH